MGPIGGSIQCSANLAPILTNPYGQLGTVGQAVSLQLAATGGNSDALKFSATGLRAGLSIRAGGLIMGTLIVAGTASVTETVSDGRSGTDSATFRWMSGTHRIRLRQPSLAIPSSLVLRRARSL